jgi:hypothetical protein
MCVTTSVGFQLLGEGLLPVSIDIAGVMENQKNCHIIATPP